MAIEVEVQRRIEELLARPYKKIIRGTTAEGFLAEVAELPGCMTAGETEAEALELLHDAMEGWFAVSIEGGLPIPDPEEEEHYSGRALVRMPPVLHRQLSAQAREQGVSLNLWMVTLLSGGSWEKTRGGMLQANDEFRQNPTSKRDLASRTHASHRGEPPRHDEA